MMKWIKRILAGLCVTGLLVTVGHYLWSEVAGTQAQVVRVGIMGSDDKIWKPLAKRLAKQGIELKLVSFTDYDQPNQALANGEIDLNAYQHQYFLQNWNKEHHTDLTAIGETVIGPLAIFSHQIKDIKKLPDGSVVTFPSDATNQARALKLLASLGYIQLKANVEFPTPSDVIANPKKLDLKPLEAVQTARSLDDATIAIVNNGVALDAKLSYHDAIYLEKITADSKPWINVIVAQKKDQNNPLLEKVVKAYQTKATAKDIEKVYEGSTFPVWNYKF